MSSLDTFLAPALAQRQEKSLYRNRSVLETAQGPHIVKDGKALVSFCSNDYLGLANHPQVVQAFTRAAQKFGVGSGASHLVSGHFSEHHALEEALAVFTGRERGLVFSSGYMANLGVVNAIAGRGDLILQDKLNHASLIDAGLLSRAQLRRYRHNDIDDLSRRLTSDNGQRRFIVVDGVFSMDGDVARLPEIVACAQQHDAWVVVDDAHGFGCLGEHGGGITEHFGLAPADIPVLVGTFSKAFGTCGAFVVGSDTLIESIIQFARTYIYTTALPPAVAAATRASLAIIQQEPERREHLQRLIQRFRQGCIDIGLRLMASATAIQPIVLGSADLALGFSRALEAKGFLVTAIRPPTVPEGSARLRVTLSAAHTLNDVESLLSALIDVSAGYDLTPGR